VYLYFSGDAPSREKPENLKPSAETICESRIEPKSNDKIAMGLDFYLRG